MRSLLGRGLRGEGGGRGGRRPERGSAECRRPVCSYPYRNISRSEVRRIDFRIYRERTQQTAFQALNGGCVGFCLVWARRGNKGGNFVGEGPLAAQISLWVVQNTFSLLCFLFFPPFGCAPARNA